LVQLKNVFGSHTFFPDSEGLSIVEPSSGDDNSDGGGRRLPAAAVLQSGRRAL